MCPLQYEFFLHSTLVLFNSLFFTAVLCLFVVSYDFKEVLEGMLQALEGLLAGKKTSCFTVSHSSLARLTKRAAKEEFPSILVGSGYGKLFLETDFRCDMCDLKHKDDRC